MNFTYAISMSGSRNSYLYSSLPTTYSAKSQQSMENLPTEIRRRGTTFECYRRLLKAFLFV